MIGQFILPDHFYYNDLFQILILYKKHLKFFQQSLFIYGLKKIIHRIKVHNRHYTLSVTVSRKEHYRNIPRFRIIL